MLATLSFFLSIYGAGVPPLRSFSISKLGKNSLILCGLNYPPLTGLYRVPQRIVRLHHHQWRMTSNLTVAVALCFAVNHVDHKENASTR